MVSSGPNWMRNSRTRRAVSAPPTTQSGTVTRGFFISPPESRTVGEIPGGGPHESRSAWILPQRSYGVNQLHAKKGVTGRIVLRARQPTQAGGESRQPAARTSHLLYLHQQRVRLGQR